MEQHSSQKHLIHPFKSLVMPAHDTLPRKRTKSTINPALLSAVFLLLIGSSTIPSASCSSQPSSANPGTSTKFSASPSSDPSTNRRLPKLHENPSEVSPADYACQPIGPCQPCPLDELTNSVCEIYHNRRLVDCIYLGSSSPALIASILRNPITFATGLMIHHPAIEYIPSIDSSSSSSLEPFRSTGPSNSTTNHTDSISHQNQIGAGLGTAEFQTWEACERVVLKEQQDFYEFVLCNLFIAALSLFIYGLRTKQLVIRQYGNLAARIGILPS